MTTPGAFCRSTVGGGKGGFNSIRLSLNIQKSGSTFLGCLRKQMIMMRMLMMMDAFRHILVASEGASIPKQSPNKEATKTIAKRMPITCGSMLGSFSSDACIQILAKLWQRFVKKRLETPGAKTRVLLWRERHYLLEKDTENMRFAWALPHS